MSYYLANFSGSTGCTVGNLDFSDFTYNSGGTNSIAASSVGVSPIDPGGMPGLNFDPNASLEGSNLTEDVVVGFTVTALSGYIDSVGIGFGNVTVTDGATALYNETFCGGPEDACSLFVEAPYTSGSDTVNLSKTDIGGPVSSLTIVKDVQLSTGSNPLSVAETSSFYNAYCTTVPEPRATWTVLAISLLAGLIVFKRRPLT